MRHLLMTSLTLLLALGYSSAQLLADEPTAKGNTAQAAEQEKEEGFKSLFDGKSLDGWDGNPELWRVEDGAIVGQTTAEEPIKLNEFLVWEGGDVADFDLRLQFRVAAEGKGNSGVQYRSKRLTDLGKWIAGGYQADIDATNRYMGILYEERGRGILVLTSEKAEIHPTDDGKWEKKVTGSLGKQEELLKTVKPDTWVDYQIIANGNHLVHKLNGTTVVAVVDYDEQHAAKSGILAFQIHVGPPMKIEFKNIRIKDLGDDN